LKKLQQVFHFGCLTSLKYILSTFDVYFSTSLDKSNFTLMIKYLISFLKIVFLYSNFTSFLLKKIISHVSKFKTSVSKKLFSISSQKHPAFQKTAHQIVHGKPINLFHNGCQ
jgi:hypothetical protein